MPRRSPDQGAKPFELRTGVGGLPPFGGIFRSGDPATIPPHKFHLLVNMRVQPAGLITRPGLTLEFDTGVQECINGLTEDGGLHGGAILLYPGAEAGSNPATFRAIFPDSSIDYSEFAIALYGPAATVRGTNSPVLAYTTGGSYAGPTWLSRPFIFRGQAVQFASVDRNGTATVALLAINLPERSKLQASDCWRNEDGPVGDPLCPGDAGLPTPAGDTPPLWPFQHPVGSAGVLAYFDNPFTTGTWYPDAARAAADKVIDQILSIQERADNVLSGTPGVSEVLYFVAWRDNVGVIERKLVRWDGVLQSNEAVTIPDDLEVALGQQAYGPYLVSGGVDGSLEDWAAIRGEAGTWSVIGGVGWTIAPAVYWDNVTFLPRALSWAGKGAAVIYGGFDGPGANDYGPFIKIMPQAATKFEDAWTSSVCTLWLAYEVNQIATVWDCLICGNRAYALGADGGQDLSGYLFSGEFGASQTAGVLPIKLTGGAPAGPPNVPIWIQSIGGRVYIGGLFPDWNPVSQAADVAHHGVYDVTDPTAIFNVYRVEATEQTNDAVAERYSRGALPSVPNDDAGGEGFQAS